MKTILSGDHDDFGAEKLKGLKKILPEEDEIHMLKDAYAQEKLKLETEFESGPTINDEQKPKLGNAEDFILRLVDVSK